jgi:L-ribulose-5-phosphate 3-epimerase
MRTVTPMELGLVFWAEEDAASLLDQLEAFDIHAGQLGVPPSLNCDEALDGWAKGIKERDVAISSAVCSYAGEDYSNLEVIHKTVGFTTEGLREDRIARTKAVSEFARSLKVPSLSCHIGFIPNDPATALYQDLCDLTRSLCDYCDKNGQNFVLETGQESAEVLLSFIHHVDRENLKVNFDPANMIMYGSGDPLAALKILSPHVISVHCKDAHSPVAGSGLLGKECALGDGEVDFPAFLEQLKKINYQESLCIEREEPDASKRVTDIRTAVQRLTAWKSSIGS